MNSTSGGLRILAPGPDTPPPAAPPYGEAAPQGQPTGPEVAAGPASADASSTTDAAAGEAPVEALQSGTTAEETWSLEETPDTASAEDTERASSDQDAPDELTVLQALERGDIDVDEAAARLERARRSGNVG